MQQILQKKRNFRKRIVIEKSNSLNQTFSKLKEEKLLIKHNKTDQRSS